VVDRQTAVLNTAEKRQLKKKNGSGEITSLKNIRKLQEKYMH
jgi:hypothetical protein